MATYYCPTCQTSLVIQGVNYYCSYCGSVWCGGTVGASGSWTTSKQDAVSTPNEPPTGIAPDAP